MSAKIRQYFKKINSSNENDFMYRCEIENCGKEINGKKESNLGSHVRRKHQFFYDNNIAFRPKNDEEPLPVTRLKFIQNCAKMVAVSGRPFRSLSDPGFIGHTEENMKKLQIGALADGLSAPNYSAVKQHINYLADRVFAQIRSEVQNNFVCVMVDGASKFRRSILGISIQYVCEGTVVLRSVGMINLTSSHTAAYLMEQILSRLNFIGVENNRIISITTDNAPNMLAVPDLINTYSIETSGIESDSDDDVGGHNDMRRFFIVNSGDEDDEEDGEEASEGVERNALLADILNDKDVFRAKLQQLKERFGAQTMNVNGVRCGVHFLQLGVKDALKGSDASGLIGVCRNACKFLRKPSTALLLRENGIIFSLPRLDVKTRWTSLNDMVINLIKNFRDFFSFLVNNFDQFFFMVRMIMINEGKSISP